MDDAATGLVDLVPADTPRADHEFVQRERTSWVALIPNEAKGRSCATCGLPRSAHHPRPEPADEPISEVMQDDMTTLMRVLGISTHARPGSPHEVMINEIIPKVRRLESTVEAMAKALEHADEYIAGDDQTAGAVWDEVRAALASWRGLIGGERS